jgi:hypothetical protein
MMPSWTSGRPIWVLGESVAIRQWQASASSYPPPTHAPWIAATTGRGKSSTSIISSCPFRLSASASTRFWSLTNSSMSAPAMNVSALPEMNTTARAPAFARSWVISSSNSRITPAVSLLTGSPGRSNVTTAMALS